MTEHSFESALAECLAAIDAGAAVEDVLARFPAHIEQLRPVLGLRAALDVSEAPLPPTMRTRGEQRLRAALASPAPSGGIPVLSSLFGLLPKAATQALIALAVTGGAIGASAAAGGPNIPGEVLQAVGLVNENANENADDNQAKGKAKKATATATAGVTLLSEGGENAENGLKGLCNAFQKGGLGQAAAGKGKGEGDPAAAPLARIDAARGTQSRDVFCAELLDDTEEASIASTAESGNSGRGKGLEKSGNAGGTAPGRGKAPEAPGKSQ